MSKIKDNLKTYLENKKDIFHIGAKSFKDKYLTWPPKINIRENVQKFAGGMMNAVILLIIVGFFVGIGTGFAALTHEGSFWNTVWNAFNTVGFKIMGFLPLWFCLALTFTIAKGEKGFASMAALFAYVSLLGLINLFGSAWGQNPLGFNDVKSLWGVFAGIKTYNFGIFMGIIIGLWVPYIHNRSYKKEFGTAFAFFGGPKWTIVKISLYIIPFAAIVFWLWPLADAGISGIGKGITKTGLGGTFLFGALDKALLPIGLHHLIAFPIEYTQAGGSLQIGGLTQDAASGGTEIIKGTKGVADWTATFHGVRNILNMQAASVTADSYITHNFTSGRILFQLGGYGGIATALILTAKKENRKKVASISLPAVATAAFVGISEPIEYTFLFTAPWLYYLVHVPFAGLAYVLAEVTDVSINGHALFFMIPNTSQPDKVHALSLLYLIPLYFLMYLGAFYTAIRVFNLKTPGREDESKTVKLFSKKDYLSKKENNKNEKVDKNIKISFEEQIITAFGGQENITSVTNCATRLRVSVKDDSKVAEREVWTNELKAAGVVHKGTAYQIIYGPHVTNIAIKVKEKLNIE